MILEKGYIILKPKATSRKDWEKAFKRMYENKEDKPLISNIFEDKTSKNGVSSIQYRPGQS